jgi:hypothetical protein
MKSLRSFVSSALVASALLAGGCEDTGTAPPTDGGALPDGSTPITRQVTYTPTGCGYEVVSAQVRSAALHSEVIGTTPAPDHVHTSFAGPTTSTFVVNWRTLGADTLATQVLYGTDQAAVAAAAGATTGVSVQSGHSMKYDPAGGFLVHETHVCGLTPSTRYFYKVGGTGAWSGVFDVSTGPTVGTPEIWRFGVTGDSRNEPAIFAETQARLQAAAVDMQLFSGDAVVLGPNQGEWDAFFEATNGTVSVQDVLARIPFMVANGNHEGFATNFLAQFAVPQDVTPGERGEGEEWYSFDYANAHFIVLNDTSTADLIAGAQRTWLRADLAAVDRSVTPWVFVMHHSPMYTCATAHGPEVTLRASWQPLFDEFGVDFVFSGHNHEYERSLPIRGFASGTTEGQVQPSGTNGIPQAANGTVYVVAAGAGAPLYGVDQTSTGYTVFAESTRNYVVLEIEGKTMRFHAYRLDGTDLDVFEYTRP